MPIILSARNLGKRFPGVKALEGVNVDVEAGTVHALMGENGAGKSTLGKILAGLYAPDEGEILLDGAPAHFHGPQDAVAAGISIVHQELLFAENLTVADNLSLGDLPNRGLWIDEGRMRERAREWLAAIGADIDPDAILGSLPVSKQQLVQIAGAAGRGARVLIFDEPTSSLSRSETERLLDLIREFKKNGVTCLYVSHRLEEIFAVCDRITVLRDGQVVDTVPIQGLTRDDLVQMMIGRKVEEAVASEITNCGDELLRVEGLTSPGKFRDVSFSVKAGEILGLGGLVGAGRTEVLEALFGLDRDAAGSIFVKGQPIAMAGPEQAMKQGLGLVPEDRKRHGLVLGLSSKENVSLPSLDRVASFTWIRRREERDLAQKYFSRMRVKAPSIETVAAGLSGGNQQKLVIAKWLAAQSEILLVDEPTRGVDVGAKAEIHGLLRELAAQGKAVVMVSSDLPELLALSTRILIMREGKLVGELAAGAKEDQAMRLMAGVGV